MNTATIKSQLIEKINNDILISNQEIKLIREFLSSQDNNFPVDFPKDDFFYR